MSPTRRIEKRIEKRQTSERPTARRRQKFNIEKRKPDLIVLILAAIFLIFGLIMIFEGSVYNAHEIFHDRFHFVTLQGVWIVLGVIAGSVFYFWDYHQYSKLVVPAMIGSVFLLIVVLFMGRADQGAGGLISGGAVQGAKRWIYIGSLPIQPAELVKPVFILYLASWLSRDRKGFKDFREAIRHHFLYELLAFLALLGLVGGLVILEPDLGTTIVICAVAFSIYFASGQDSIHTFGSALIVMIGGLLGSLAALLKSYRLERVKTFLHLFTTGEVTDARAAGYQMQQILIGIGTGGFWGVGFGQSRQRLGYLVENTAFTDSIFAVIIEELGMLGGLILIVLYLVLLGRAFTIARNAPDKLGRLLAGGVGFWLVFQAFVHMAANVALIPLTGVPLTFISYGGSSTIVALIGLGMLLNVSRFSKSTNL